MLRLLAGRTVTLLLDSSLLLPPCMPQERASFVSKRYDTVLGIHPFGYTIYAVYSNQRSFTEFLVAYF